MGTICSESCRGDKKIGAIKMLWRHCPGKVNPADLASRGATSTDSGALQTWLNGPQWMLKDTGNKEVEEKNNTEFREECI